MFLKFSLDFLANPSQILILAQTALKMEAIEFVIKYESYLEEIERVIKPKLQSALDELRQIDPHDLVRPESWFPSEDDAKGFVWALFMNEVKKSNKTVSVQSK